MIIYKEVGEWYSITNFPEKVSNFGVVHLGISDHFLVFITGKAYYDRIGTRTVEMRHFKNFQKVNFLNDLEQIPWRNVSWHSDLNYMWQESREKQAVSVDNKTINYCSECVEKDFL